MDLKQRQLLLLQEDKDFGYWGVDFQAYSSRAKELGLFLDRRPVQPLFQLHYATFRIMDNGIRHAEDAWESIT